MVAVAETAVAAFLPLACALPLSGQATPQFAEVTAARGVDFTHQHFGRGDKQMPENMGPGVLVVDLTGDDLVDLYFPQGAPLPTANTGSSPPTTSDSTRPVPGNQLFVQQPDGTFRDDSKRSGLADSGYGMGAFAADIDGDTDLDVYVTNYGANVLFRNLGGGRFENITELAGVGSELWSTGASFFDADQDGDLDLYVANYVDFSADNHRFCGNARRKLRSYCHPDVYGALPDLFYRNLGDGTFREETLYAGFLPRGGESVDPNSKGLGVVAVDLSADGRQDVVVANDSTMNFYFTARVGSAFREGALLAGVGFNADGKPEASMGIAVGDVNRDARLDLLMTHLDNETNTLYLNTGGGLLIDSTSGSGLASASLPWVGFGAAFLDGDLDGDLDLAVTNGHIIDNIDQFDAQRRHRQPLQYFVGSGDGRFEEASQAMAGIEDLVGRGLVAADLDGDGDQDLVITQNNGPALLLENRSVGRSIKVRLMPRDGRAPYGTRVTLRTRGGKSQTQVVVGAASYLSQGPSELVFGLGQATPSRLEIVWPDRTGSQHGGLEAGALMTVRQGTKKVEKRPFAARTGS